MCYLSFEKKIAQALRKRALTYLRYSMGLIFFWYGALKISGQSPVDELVIQAIAPWFENHFMVSVVGFWEVAIGVCLFWKPLLRYGLFLLFLHFPGTFLPLFIKPEACFTSIPFGLTLEGQYIFKNLILIAVGLVLFASLHSKKEQ